MRKKTAKPESKNKQDSVQDFRGQILPLNRRAAEQQGRGIAFMEHEMP
jgi:hypothetical protein